MIKDYVVKLMLVTNKQDLPLSEYLNFITKCAESGITSVQLREKKLNHQELLAFGQQLQEILKPLNIALIINDHVQVAKKLDAAGVHLGQSDGDVLEARALLGPDKIIGLTVDSEEQLAIANTLPIDYVGIGAIFETKTKPNITTMWGCDRLKLLAPHSRHPIIAIGGITAKNAGLVMQSGANGIAAIGTFHDTKDPITATKSLRNIIDGINHTQCSSHSNRTNSMRPEPEPL